MESKSKFCKRPFAIILIQTRTEVANKFLIVAVYCMYHCKYSQQTRGQKRKGEQRANAQLFKAADGQSNRGFSRVPDLANLRGTAQRSVFQLCSCPHSTRSITSFSDVFYLHSLQI